MLSLHAPSVSFFCIYSVPYHVFGTYEPDVQKMHDFCKIVLTLLYTRLDRVEITCSKNDLEVTGVIAGSVAGENISRDDDGRLRQKVAQSIDFFELYQLVSFLHN